MIVTSLGGIGLFILGMILLTDGLKSLAGDAMRVLLTRAVSNQWSGAAWGALLTALVQSSSATTLITIGLVSAGLLTFAQSFGVVVGANIGTTATGWLVALVGVKFSVAKAALPIIAIGAVLRLVGRGKIPSLGLALAGFGLLFLGLDTLASGMSDLSTRLSPGDLPSAGPILGRAALVLFGVALTVVMQSSSAAAATTLTALHSGAISLEQAAALIVGQNIGTCVTALLAMPGAPTNAKRTAIAHVAFNLTTGTFVFGFLDPFTDAVRSAAQAVGLDSPTTTVALFHTAFNLLGAALVLPLARPFAALIERVLPDRGLTLVSALDESVARVPEVALEAARRSIGNIVAASIDVSLDPHGAPARNADEVTRSLDAVRSFFPKIGSSAGFAHQQDRLVRLFHALDHAERLADAAGERANAALASRILDESTDVPDVVQGLVALASWLRDPTGPPPVDDAARLSKDVAEWRKHQRVRTIEVGASIADTHDTLRRLDAIRWIDRVVYHVWRVVAHLAEPTPRAADEPLAPQTPPTPPREPGPEIPTDRSEDLRPSAP